MTDIDVLSHSFSAGHGATLGVILLTLEWQTMNETLWVDLLYLTW